MQKPVSCQMTLDLKRSVSQLFQRSTFGGTNCHPAVFMDRDGTLNVERGYVCKPEEVELLPTVGEALRLLNMARMPVIVITNQSALGRGLITLDEFEVVNEALWQALRDQGAYYDALYYCPHNPGAEAEPCGCRKPQPGLLLQAAVDLGIDLQRSFMIGDKASDLGAGRAAGCRVVLVRTGWGERTLSEGETDTTKPDYIADTLLEAVQWILRNL